MIHEHFTLNQLVATKNISISIVYSTSIIFLFRENYNKKPSIKIEYDREDLIVSLDKISDSHVKYRNRSIDLKTRIDFHIVTLLCLCERKNGHK